MALEEALDRAKPEDKTLPRKDCANFLNGRVPTRSKRCHHGFTIRLDPIRAPIAAKGSGAWVALFNRQPPPAADAGGTHTKTIGSLAMCRAGSHGSKNTNAKINR